MEAKHLSIHETMYIVIQENTFKLLN